jgi:hypothetical protein
MTRLFVRHTVANYSAWRKVYDAFDTQRRPLGVQAHGVYRSLDNDNDVTAWHDFETPEQAKAFVGSDALKNAMKNSGVQGAPSIWITNEA